MAESKVSKRYAKSLLDFAIEKKIESGIFKDINFVLSTIQSNKKLSLFFKSPIINTDKKDAALQSLFGNHVDKVLLTFFKIITRKNREYYIEDIAQAYIDLYKIYNHQQTAFLTTAIAADDEIRNQMLRLIKRSTDDEIELKEIIDPEIIGGFILRWGDRQVDTSVTKKLHSLRQDFKDNLYQKDY